MRAQYGSMGPKIATSERFSPFPIFPSSPFFQPVVSKGWSSGFPSWARIFSRASEYPPATYGAGRESVAPVTKGRQLRGRPVLFSTVIVM